MAPRFCSTAIGLSLAIALAGSPHDVIAGPKLAATTARAEAEAYANRAVEHFKAGDFDKAAKLFMEAYARSHKPALVYNAARAYEEGGKVGDAAALFRLYLSISEDPDGIVDARERLKRLEAQREPTPRPPTEPPSPAPVPRVGAVATTPSATPSPWRWALAGGAIAATAGGVALLVTGRSGSQTANEMTVASEQDIGKYNETYDRAETQWWSGLGATAAGVALGATAAWLFLRRESSGPRVSAAPSQGGVLVMVTL